ncbi:TolC family protein [Sanguibacteroides justesenii]|uniref:TolC family protein n=1 Tax=Sanguibacteroides justesenii TaxID=1547597 RepID=UPI000D814DB5|nr:TolC family protein [Sanguibacteroides justesenii]PXZ44620.1 TolC family protein [Sanguibacteroides justesenii]
MKKGVPFFLIFLLVPWLLRSQEVPQTLSLRQAIEYAIKHNKELQSSQLEIDLYKQKVRESVSQGLPQINGTLDYNTNFGYKMDFGGNSMKMKDQSNVKASLQQLIFSGQWILGIQTSKIAERLTEQQVEITELDIVENICNSYYTILVSERMLDILRQNLENMNKIYQHTDNMYKAGTVEVTDVDQIRITVGQLKNSLLSMERTVEVNYNLLRLQLGLVAGTAVKLTDNLTVFLDENKARQLSETTFDIQKNPEFQIMQTQTELNKKMLGLEKWSYAPTISGSYTFNHKLLKPEFDMSAKHSASLTMTIPIFSGFERKSKVAQAKIQLDQTNINKSLLEDQLNLQDEQLKFELRNAIENYNLQKENIDVAGRVLANYQRKYEFGAVSSLDLTQANNNYLQAENNYTNAVLTLLQAQLNIERLYNQLPH